jgi:transcriptional regulator with XRE-family HTH domain
MERRGESQADLARLLELDRSQVSRKLSGDIQWTIGDIEVMTLHYNKDFWELFRKNVKEDRDENIIKD